MVEAAFTLPLWAFAVAGIVLILLAIGLVFKFKNFLANSLFGIAALLVINYFGTSYGISVPINLITFLITGILGLAGAGLLLLLHFFGVKLY
ncbi:MAG: pro-sigmaK processing inhibitor BofA family protein [Candidatus Micrarchaeota archaeon]